MPNYAERVIVAGARTASSAILPPTAAVAIPDIAGPILPRTSLPIDARDSQTRQSIPESARVPEESSTASAPTSLPQTATAQPTVTIDRIQVAPEPAAPVLESRIVSSKHTEQGDKIPERGSQSPREEKHFVHDAREQGAIRRSAALDSSRREAPDVSPQPAPVSPPRQMFFAQPPKVVVEGPHGLKPDSRTARGDIPAVPPLAPVATPSLPSPPPASVVERASTAAPEPPPRVDPQAVRVNQEESRPTKEPVAQPLVAPPVRVADRSSSAIASPSIVTPVPRQKRIHIGAVEVHVHNAPPAPPPIARPVRAESSQKSQVYPPPTVSRFGLRL